MNATISPARAVLTLLCIATVFGTNHIAARIAFDHGASVATGVFARAAVPALVLYLLYLHAGAQAALSRTTLLHGTVIGLFIALQSFCIFSAVARIPVALALLAFNTYPMLIMLIEWRFDGQHPGNRALVAIPLALGGLVLALDLLGPDVVFEGRWGEIGAGVLFALGASCSYTGALVLTNRWMKTVEGRTRSWLTLGVSAIAILTVALPTDSLVFPGSGAGWLALAWLTTAYGIAITLLLTVMPKPGVSRHVAALNFEPVAVLAMGWAILGQSVKPLQFVGAAVVVGALVLLGSRK